MLKEILKIFSRKKEERGAEEVEEYEEEEEEIERKLEALEKERPEPFVLEDIPKYRRRPNLIFVGSGKGGVGKSLLSSNLVVIASALSRADVYAVDLDLDNYTLSKVLQPEGSISKLIAKLQAAGIDDYLNLASILRNGVVQRGVVIPVMTATAFACNGTQLRIKYRLIPAYNVLHQKEQEVALRSLTPRLLLSGIHALVDYFNEKRATNKDIIVVFDGKQKSNIGIEYEPLYRLMIDYADVFILPVESPNLSFSDIIAPYKNVLDKLIIVVNRAEPAIRDRVQALIRDAIDRNIPVFLMPKVPADGDLFRNFYTPPAMKSLTRPTALHAMAIAYFLNILDDELVKMYGCTQVYRLLRMYGRLYESLRGG